MKQQQTNLEAIATRLERIETIVETEQVDVLTIEAVQQMTGLSRSALYEKIRVQPNGAADLGHYKRGRRVYFSKAEVVRWLTEEHIPGRSEVEHLAVNEHRARH